MSKKDNEPTLRYKSRMQQLLEPLLRDFEQKMSKLEDILQDETKSINLTKVINLCEKLFKIEDYFEKRKEVAKKEEEENCREAIIEKLKEKIDRAVGRKK